MISHLTDIYFEDPIVDFTFNRESLHISTKTKQIIIIENIFASKKQYLSFQKPISALLQNHLITSDGTVSIIDNDLDDKNKYQINSIHKINEPVIMGHLSHNNYFIATKSRKIFVYDKKFRLLTTLFAADSEIVNIFSYNNYLGVISQLDSRILIFDLITKQNLVLKIKEYSDYPHSGLFISEQEVLIGTEKSLYKFNRINQTVICRYSVKYPILCLERLGTSNYIIIGDSEGYISVADIQDSFVLKHNLYVGGCILDIKVKDSHIFIATSNEPRSGRWIVKKDDKIKICVFKIDNLENN